MLGTVPVPGTYSTGDLANILTGQEQLDRSQVTALTADTAAGSTGNLATFVASAAQLGSLTICASGAACQGTKVISGTTININGTQTSVDVYRLTLGS
jgi:hypothetical protein